MPVQVHWEEGLFMQPHHLQFMQRSLLEEVQCMRRLALPFNYGVIESRLLHDELKNYRVQFESLRVLMPSGRLIEVPGNAELESLPIKRALATSPGGITVGLGLPLWSARGANVALPPEVTAGAGITPRADNTSYLYRLEPQVHPDENTGKNEQKLRVRCFNVRLLIQTASEQTWPDLEFLPLLRFRRASDREEDLPREDELFAPPSLVLQGAPAIRRLATELAARLASTRDDLADKHVRGDLSGDEQARSLLRLRSLARFAARLDALASVAAVTPFDIYLLLRELHADLTALMLAAGQSSEEFEVARYDHDDPLPAFEELNTSIRRKLIVRQRPFHQAPFLENTRANPQAVLKPDDLEKYPSIFLGVRPKSPPKSKEERKNLVDSLTDPNRFKVMPLPLELKPGYGVEVTGPVSPPPELPADRWMYFQLGLRESRHWEQIKESRTLVLVWNKIEMPHLDAEFALYMTVPD